MFPATVVTLLSYLDAGAIVADKFAELMLLMQAEQRDLTDEELSALDVERDATHDSVQAALDRKRAREVNGAD